MTTDQTFVIAGAGLAGAKAAETLRDEGFDGRVVLVGGMEYAGFASSWDRVVFRGDPASREFIAFWLLEDRVVAGMNVNVWDVTDPIQRLIRARVAVDDGRLADADVPLDALAPLAAG